MNISSSSSNVVLLDQEILHLEKIKELRKKNECLNLKNEEPFLDEAIKQKKSGKGV